MVRWLCLFTFLYLLVNASVAFAEPVTLRARIEASGSSVTLGDVFEGAGAAGARAIAPAPPPGQTSTLSASLLAGVASAAGFEWAPPVGLIEVNVVRPGGMRATLAPASAAANPNTLAASPRGAGEAVVRRGDAVTVSYNAGGIRISLRTRAMENGAVGQSVSFANPSAANHPIEATIIAPGAARAETP